MHKAVPVPICYSALEHEGRANKPVTIPLYSCLVLQGKAASFLHDRATWSLPTVVEVPSTMQSAHISTAGAWGTWVKFRLVLCVRLCRQGSSFTTQRLPFFSDSEKFSRCLPIGTCTDLLCTVSPQLPAFCWLIQLHNSHYCKSYQQNLGSTPKFIRVRCSFILLYFRLTPIQQNK